MRVLVVIPVYNEEKYLPRAVSNVLEHASDVVVIDDGSSDRTPELLARVPVDVIRHARNQGYGRSIRDAFSIASCRGFDWVITMDCDEQHEPHEIPNFIRLAQQGHADVISGSRYLHLADHAPSNGVSSTDLTPIGEPPPDRRRINALMTAEINQRLAPVLGLHLTDAFCGFKAFRVDALRRLKLTEDGYAFPMQFWVQAAAPPQGGPALRVVEYPVKLIYNDPNRSFGGPLDDAEIRLGHYRRVLRCELLKQASRLPPSALVDVGDPCSGQPS